MEMAVRNNLNIVLKYFRFALKLERVDSSADKGVGTELRPRFEPRPLSCMIKYINIFNIYWNGSFLI